MATLPKSCMRSPATTRFIAATKGMTHPTVIKLHDGNLMPQLGLGVWKAGNEEVVSAIHKALEVGYRSFDTAAAYQNETGVGNALHSAGVNRDELFITTKLWNDDQKRPHEALKESLSKLKLDYVDLYLIHWPVPAIGHYVEAWQALIELQQQGLTKSIGVCNFQVPHLQKLIDETGVAPVINQIELHPLMQQRQLHAWNATHKIQTESWSPLAQGGEGVFDQKVIHQLSDKPRRHVRNGTDRLSGAFRQPITTNGFDSRFHSNENWFVNHRDTRGFAQSALPTAGRR